MKAKPFCPGRERAFVLEFPLSVLAYCRFTCRCRTAHNGSAVRAPQQIYNSTLLLTWNFKRHRSSMEILLADRITSMSFIFPRALLWSERKEQNVSHSDSVASSNVHRLVYVFPFRPTNASSSASINIKILFHASNRAEMMKWWFTENIHQQKSTKNNLLFFIHRMFHIFNVQKYIDSCGHHT